MNIDIEIEIEIAIEIEIDMHYISITGACLYVSNIVSCSRSICITVMLICEEIDTKQAWCPEGIIAACCCKHRAV